uniref:glutathione transferase n=1 Tax=Steinernema glaseri TaxID=37863 RepID=A0A1I8A1M6_9BILA
MRSGAQPVTDCRSGRVPPTQPAEIFLFCACSSRLDPLPWRLHSSYNFGDPSSERKYFRRLAHGLRGVRFFFAPKMPIIPQYKLTYFNAMGRAEPTRMLFAYSGVDYKDERIEKEQWPAMKSKFPFGQLPVLEVDGKTLAQSHAIEKFLARTFGMAGGDDWEAAKIDELVFGVEDLVQKTTAWFKEEDEKKKIEIFRTLVETEIDPFLGRYQNILKENGTGFFIGDKMTLADISVFCLLHYFSCKLLPGHLEKYPELKAFVASVASNPKIKEWIDKRPKTDV